jgi:large subunit ribosomal protein L24
MRNRVHVKKGDTVRVIAGDSRDRKKTGKVTEVYPAINRVTVENVNLIVKHKKPKGAKDPGGKVTLAGPINASNVMVVCPACNLPTRVNYKVTADENGKTQKTRVCKKCGAVLDTKVESVKLRKERKSKEKAAKKEVKEKKGKVKAEKAAAEEKDKD